MRQDSTNRPNLAELVLTAEAIGDRITPDLLMNTALATELRSAAEDMVALMSMHWQEGESMPATAFKSCS